MKRSLLLAALFAAPVYLRQRELERGQHTWKRVLLEELRKGSKRQHEELEKVLRSWERWGDDLVKQIIKAGRP